MGMRGRSMRRQHLRTAAGPCAGAGPTFEGGAHICGGPSRLSLDCQDRHPSPTRRSAKSSAQRWWGCAHGGPPVHPGPLQLVLGENEVQTDGSARVPSQLELTLMLRAAGGGHSIMGAWLSLKGSCIISIGPARPWMAETPMPSWGSLGAQGWALVSDTWSPKVLRVRRQERKAQTRALQRDTAQGAGGRGAGGQAGGGHRHPPGP